MKFLKQYIKRLLFGAGIKQKKIIAGLASGIKMNIDMAHKLQRYLGLDEREVQSWFKKFAQSSSLFVDIGASDAYYGLIYFKLNNLGEQFLCDANPNFVTIQKENFLLNGYDMSRVHLVSKFISNQEDATHVSLDRLVTNTSSTIFIKIDVDGGELHVLKGMEKTLATVNCKIIVETHSVELEKDCIEFLYSQGYQTAIIDNAWWRFLIPEQRPIPHNRWFKAERSERANAIH